MKKYILLILLPFLAFTFTGGPPSGWYQQDLPNLGGQSIQDMIFLDSLTGFVISSKNVNPDSSSILKTTNGGDNWQIIFSQTPRKFSSIKFINALTGFVSGGSGGGTPYLYKTTNGGDNWFIIPGATFGTAFWNDMSVLNEDTIWLVDNNSLNGGVFRTTNGGVNWTQQLNIGSQNPNHIYMINGSTGFIAEDFHYLRKTTNGGINWNLVGGTDGFLDMHFINPTTGWKSYGFMKKTTDGGDTWITQPLQTGGQLITSNMARFCVLNKDTIWGVGGQIFYGGSQTRGVLWRTTNGGDNWAYQAPDTAFGNFNYYHIQFIDPLKGWAYSVSKGVHTVTGGDPNFTSINQLNNTIPITHKLYQNYPNPFNPVTVIQYEIQKPSNVQLIVYDITGRAIKDIINKYQTKGGYSVNFDGSKYTSGVYFYSLIIDGKLLETKKMLLVK